MLSSKRKCSIPGPRQPEAPPVYSDTSKRTAEAIAAYQAKRQAPIAERLAAPEQLSIVDIGKWLAKTALRPALVKLGVATGAALLAGTGAAVASPYLHGAFYSKAQADVARPNQRLLEAAGPIVIPEIVRTRAAATLAVKSESGVATGTRVGSDIILYPPALTSTQYGCGSVMLTSGNRQVMSNETRPLERKGIASTDERADNPLAITATMPVLDKEQIPRNGELVYVVTQPINEAGEAEPQIHPAKMAGRTGPTNYGLVVLGKTTGAVTPAASGEAFGRNELQGGSIIDSDGDFLGMVTHSQSVTVQDLSFATGHEIAAKAANQSVYVASALPVSAATLAEMRQLSPGNVVPAC
jgi:hypothetical protein